MIRILYESILNFWFGKFCFVKLFIIKKKQTKNSNFNFFFFCFARFAFDLNLKKFVHLEIIFFENLILNREISVRKRQIKINDNPNKYSFLFHFKYVFDQDIMNYFILNIDLELLNNFRRKKTHIKIKIFNSLASVTVWSTKLVNEAFMCCDKNLHLTAFSNICQQMCCETKDLS